MLEQQGIGIAIMGERELAFSLTQYALLSLGISDEKARHVVQSVRLAGDGGVYERRFNQPPSGVPELRRH
jgi:CPA2 family monovalent cation:H+ antiporter-2